MTNMDYAAEDADDFLRETDNLPLSFMAALDADPISALRTLIKSVSSPNLFYKHC
jgi:hypothetical protein